MMKFVLASAIAIALGGCCFGSELEQAEFSYQSNIDDLDELIKRADGDLVAEIEKEKADFVAKYEAIESGDAKKRATALEEINSEMWSIEDGLSDKVEKQEASAEAEAEKIAEEEKWENINKVKGVWAGNGMDLTIDNHGQVDYKRTKGAGSKSIAAPITKFKGKKMEVGALGFTTTFKIDKFPYEEDGETKMKVDGVVLTLKKEI